MKRNWTTYSLIIILLKRINKEVQDEYISARLPDKAREIKDFISYSIGCIFGRYS